MKARGWIILWSIWIILFVAMMKISYYASEKLNSHIVGVTGDGSPIYFTPPGYHLSYWINIQTYAFVGIVALSVFAIVQSRLLLLEINTLQSTEKELDKEKERGE